MDGDAVRAAEDPVIFQFSAADMFAQKAEERRLCIPVVEHETGIVYAERTAPVLKACAAAVGLTLHLGSDAQKQQRA